MSNLINETFQKHLKLLHKKLKLNEGKYYDAQILDNGDYKILAINGKDNPLEVKVGDIVKKGVATLKQYYSDGDYFNVKKLNLNENTDTLNSLLGYLEQHSNEIKHYKKFAKVKARQSKGGEEVQTKLNGRSETSVRTTNPDEWIVSNISSQGEQQIVDDKTFRKRYDVENPNNDIYSPKNADFYGVEYDGSLGDNITFAPPNWGGSTMNIIKGYMIGGPDSSNMSADFYGIDPEAFKNTYKLATQVNERLGKSVNEFEDVDLVNEGFEDILIAMAIAGAVLLSGKVGYDNIQLRKKWTDAYEKIEFSDPEKAARIKNLIAKHRFTSSKYFGRRQNAKEEIESIIDDFNKSTNK